MFIKLTDCSEGEIFVNINQIERFKAENEILEKGRGSKTWICMLLEYVSHVKETPEEIMQLIKEDKSEMIKLPYKSAKIITEIMLMKDLQERKNLKIPDYENALKEAESRLLEEGIKIEQESK